MADVRTSSPVAGLVFAWCSPARAWPSAATSREPAGEGGEARVHQPEAEESRAPQLGPLPKRAGGGGDATAAAQSAPPAKPEGDGAGQGSPPTGKAASAEGAAHGSASPVPRPDIPNFTPERSSLDDRADRIGVAPLGSQTRRGAPDTITELDIDDPSGVVWQKRPAGPHKPPLPRRDDLEVLAALHELRFLLTSQIGRRFMLARKERSVRHRLNLMFRAGWLRRCEITSRKAGHNQRVLGARRGRLRADPGEPRAHRARPPRRPRREVAQP